MDKEKISHQIALMKDIAIQAKVHVIHRLVKQSRLLQKCKGKEDQVLKAKRKADRMLTEIAIIKKIKPDAISKIAISKAMDWNSVLQQKNATLEDRCIAMLTSFKSLQKEIEKFYADNKEFISKIPECLKELEEDIKNQNEVSPKQIVKASATSQKFKSRHTVRNDEMFSQVGNDQFLQKSDCSSPNIKSPFSKSLEEHERSNDGDNTNFDTENKKEKFSSEQCKNMSEYISCIESNCDLQKLHIPLASSSSHTDDKVENDLTSFQDNNNSSSDEFVDDSSTSHAAVTNICTQENKNEWCLKNAKEKAVLHVNKKDNNFEDKGSKMYSDINDAKHTKLSAMNKICEFTTKETVSNKSCNVKAIKQLNLEELKDSDEIVIISSSYSENLNTKQKSGKKSDRKEQSDPFFLRDGETISDVETDIKEPLKNYVRKSGFEKNYISSHSGIAKFSSTQDFNKGIKLSSDNKIPKSFKFKHDTIRSDSIWSVKRYSSNSNQLDISPKREMYQNKNVQNSLKVFRKDRTNSFQEAKFTNSKKYHESSTKKYSLKLDQLDISSKQGMRQIKQVPNNSKVFRKDKTTSFQEAKFTNSKKDHKFCTKRTSETNKDLPIHPSWAAKRKLKETVQFEGKRMVFDD